MCTYAKYNMGQSSILENCEPNITRTFLQLASKYFTSIHEILKIFNKDTEKVSYSCMKNMSPRISAHFQSILSTKQNSF